jgi:glycosyltransferase involved in cell wall biosynthesis
MFDVTLISLGGSDAAGRVPPALAARCQKVIEPENVSRQAYLQNHHHRPGRLTAWARLLRTLVCPYRRQWTEFLALQLQYAAPSATADRRLLRWIVRTELHLLSLVSAMPPLTSLLFSAAWQQVRARAEASAAEQFDVVWVEHTLVWPFARQLLQLQSAGRPVVICSGHNVEHQVLLRQAQQAQPGIGRWYLERQTLMMKRMELDAWQSASLIIQCSQADAKVTKQQIPQVDVLEMPNGVDPQYFARTSPQANVDTPVLVLTAGFGYGPNAEGLRWFLNCVFPLIQAVRPDVQFLFAGSAAAAAAASMSPLPAGVRYVSDPPDIRPTFESGLVFVVPLLSGGGSRLKILEAMSMQLPVVSTTLGAEGVPYIDGVHLLLADQPADFAAAVVRLLAEPELRTNIVQAASQFVHNGYSWAALCGDLQEKIEAKLALPRAGHQTSAQGSSESVLRKSLP